MGRGLPVHDYEVDSGPTGVNNAFGVTMDRFVACAIVFVLIAGSIGKGNAKTTVVDAAGDASPGSVDIISVEVTFSQTRLDLEISLAAKPAEELGLYACIVALNPSGGADGVYTASYGDRIFYGSYISSNHEKATVPTTGSSFSSDSVEFHLSRVEWKSVEEIRLECITNYEDRGADRVNATGQSVGWRSGAGPAGNHPVPGFGVLSTAGILVFLTGAIALRKDHRRPRF